MIRYLKNRFRAYIQGIIAEKVDAIAALAALRVPEPDIMDLASKVQLQMDTDPIAERVVDLIKKTDHAVEYESLAECIDIQELAGQFDISDLAGELDLSDVASNLEASDIAEHFALSDIAEEINLSSLAEEFDEDGIAERVIESLDYKVLAGALLRELRAESVTVRPSA
jgi:hypothetical protein